MSTIPASSLVAVNPNVLPVGGSAVSLLGLMLSSGTRVPIGEVLSFPNDGQSVAAYFGASSTEAAAAANYFAGFDTSTQKPASLWFTQYPTAAVGAWLRGGNVGQLTLTELQAITPGTLTLSINGAPITSASISLAAATSFSNAATLIEAGFTAPGFAVTYDSIAGAFVFTTTATGATETITFPTTDAFATALYLTEATGAVLSQGAAQATPAAFMSALVAQYQNWASFMTLFDPDAGSGNTLKQAFALWANGQNKNYAYICGDTDITPTESTSASTSLGAILAAAKENGTVLIDGDPALGWNETMAISTAAFIAGALASIDFDAPGGRTNLAFRTQAGLLASVSNATIATNLVANGYNFYGAYGSATGNFVSFQPGSISGEYAWIDSYANQIWLNRSLQANLIALLQQVNLVPYDQAGYDLIRAAMMDTINTALSNGVFQVGVTLSASQIAEVNTAAGANVAPYLQSQGYYLQVADPTPTVRAARGSPIINLWYMDGESVQKIVVNSVLVQ